MAAAPRVRRTPEERRSEIAAAARRLALEHGLVAVTLRQVAAEAGVTPALVAHYIPSMDELVADTFGDLVSRELVDLERLVADLPDAPARFRTLLDTLLDGGREDVTLVWVQSWAAGGRNEELAARVRHEMDAWTAFLERIVTEGATAGAFRVDDASAVAWQILGMLDGVNAQALVRWHGGSEPRHLMARAIEGLLGAGTGSLGPE